MKNHWWKLAVIALAVVVVAGCAGKQSASRQSGTATAARSAKAAPAERTASNTGSNVTDNPQSKKELANSNALQDTTSPKPKVNKPNGSVKPGDICPPSTPAKVKARSAVAATGPAATKPDSGKSEVRDTNAKPDGKPRPATDTPKKLPKLLDLGASKCIPCKMMASVLDELTKEYKGKIEVEFIDVWKDQSAAEKYGVQSIPTQIFYDTKGKEFYRHVGYFPKEDILKVFKDHGIKLTK